MDSIDNMRKAIVDDMLQHKEQEAKSKLENDALKVLTEAIDIDTPKSLIEQEKEMLLDRYKQDLEHHKNIKFADYLSSLGTTEEKFKEGFRDHAEHNVRVGLLLGQITKDEGIEVGDAEIEDAMAMDIIKQTAGLPSDKARELEDKIRAGYGDEQFLSSMKNSIMARKTVDLILDQIDK